MFKKALKVILILILAVIFMRAFAVMTGYGVNDNIAANRVAVLDFNGEIFGSSKIIEKIQSLEKDDTVKGIILRIDSPGGAVAPSNAIFDYLVTVDKPIYAAMGSVAASGGYLISLGADKIYAMPSTTTGSIGVIMSMMNTEELFNKIGIHSVVIKSGKFKDVGNPDRPMTEEEREVLTQIVMDLYDQFVTTVATRRNMDKNQVKKIADGRILTGRMAKELNLVDNLGTWRDAFQDMKSVLNIEDLQIYEVKEKDKWWESLMDMAYKFDNKLIRKGGFYYIAEVY